MASLTAQQTDLNDRIRTAFYGLAICDALGAPLEFTPRRPEPSQYVRDMEPNVNFGLLAGYFTDDTSMALCLATSLTESALAKSQTAQQEITSTDLTSFHDPVDQAARYVRWLDQGYMSSTPGYAFDVGNQTRQALQYWRREPKLETLDFVKQKFNLEWRAGNGSLMRVLPCALVARTEDEAAELAKRSSEVTHPHEMCLDACVVYCLLVFWALRGRTKEELARYLAEIVRGDRLGGGELGKVRIQLEPYKSLEIWKQKKREEISSSGFVVHSLEASLWAFFCTNSFEEGAIEVVNLGDDADTVGAIYGGIAGATYGRIDCLPVRWVTRMESFHMVENTVEELLRAVPT